LLLWNFPGSKKSSFDEVSDNRVNKFSAEDNQDRPVFVGIDDDDAQPIEEMRRFD